MPTLLSQPKRVLSDKKWNHCICIKRYDASPSAVTPMTTDWRDCVLSAYICPRVEHDSFLALDTSSMAGAPHEAFRRHRFFICQGAASLQPVPGGAPPFHHPRAAPRGLGCRT